MKITQKETQVNTVIISVDIKESDYAPALKDALSDYRKKINLPGFRVGKVPMGLVKQKYELPLKVEEINKILSSTIQKHISDNKLSILGNPIPVDTKVDFLKDVNYSFEYEVGLQPQIDISKVEKLKIDYWLIKPDKKAIDEHINSLQKRYGSVKSFNTMKKGDMINLRFVELDNENKPKKDGISNSSSILVDKINDEKIQKDFLKLKKGDAIIIPIKIAFTNLVDLASMLKISKEDAEKIDSNFDCKIMDISRLMPAELNIDFFKKSYPEAKIESEKDLRKKVESDLIETYSKESDKKLFNDAHALFINKVKIQFPEEFLKKWLKSNIKKEFSKAEFDKEYINYLKYLSWQLIENTICTENNIKVTNDQLESYTKSRIIAQMKSYGGMNLGNKEIDGIVQNVLKNKKEAEQMMNDLVVIELVKYFKDKMKINKKETTLNEFIKLANNQK